jgi:uncharacterized protein (DUF1330 family)
VALRPAISVGIDASTKEETMAAYLIFDVTVTDLPGFLEYARRAGPTVAQYGGRFVGGPGTPETLEGDWTPQSLVILEFPSVEQAHAWWSSPEYGEIKPIRERTATSKVLLVSGTQP